MNFGADIIDYLQRIDATLQPFEGHSIIHAGQYDQIEEAWTGDLIVIAFPSREHVHAWYRSKDYQAIASLRTNNSTGEIIFIDGVSDSHKATDVLAARD